MKQKQNSIDAVIRNKESLLSSIKGMLKEDFGGKADFGDGGPEMEFLGIALSIRGAYIQGDDLMLRVAYGENQHKDMVAIALGPDGLEALAEALGKLKEARAAEAKEKEKKMKEKASAPQRGRATLVINPTLFRQFKAAVYVNGKTVSGVIEEMMKKYVESSKKSAK